MPLALALVLQAGLLPAVPAPAAPDPQRLDALRALARTDPWPTERIAALRPATPEEADALAELLLRGTQPEGRLAALAGAGTPGNSALGAALLRFGVLGLAPEDALAGLLAVESAPTEWLPALARLAARRDAPLETRAAACALLLDAGVVSAWPLARAILLTGTAEDRGDPDWDWPRTGRYELPKRLLVLALDRLLQRHGLPPSGLEPNASWAAQVARVHALDAVVPTLETPRLPPVETLERLRRTAAGDAEAARALALVEPAFADG